VLAGGYSHPNADVSPPNSLPKDKDVHTQKG